MTPTSPQLSSDAARHVAADQLAATSPTLFLAKHYHRNARGQMLSFVPERMALLDLYLDESNEIVIQKCARAGISEWAIVKTMGKAKAGRNGIYILPDEKVRNRFVSGRIDPVIRRSSHYAANVKHDKKAVDKTSLKHIFGSLWAFEGSNSPAAFHEFDADDIIIDEHDECDQPNLNTALDRTGSAKVEGLIRLGNPSVSSAGLHVEYEASDQKLWHIPCPHCNEWQSPDWFKNVVVQTGDHTYAPRDQTYRHLTTTKLMAELDLATVDHDLEVLCVRCSQPIDRLSDGKWVARYPERMVSGYQINQIFGDPRPGPVMLKKLFRFLRALNDTTRLQHFYNKILGLPFESEGDKWTDALLANCALEDYYLPETAVGTVAGVDINLGLHTTIKKVIDGRERTIWVGQCSDYEDLEKRCKQFGVVCGGMDIGPEMHAPREWVRSHVGWFLVSYNAKDKTTQGGDASDDWKKVDWVKRVVTVNRTESLDRLLSRYRLGLCELPANWATLDRGEWARQMKNSTRVKKERPDGTFRHIWTKGEDHYLHSDNYANIAADLYDGGGKLFVVL